MKLKKGFILFLLFIPELLLGQGVSMLPSHLPENLYGSWLDGKSNVVLIISENYIVIQNELYYYNDIVKENNVINFTCIRDFNVKYISVRDLGLTSVTLDEGYKITKLAKVKDNNSRKLPKTFTGNWLALKNKIKLSEDKVLYKDDFYIVDYVVSTNVPNYYFVFYREGDYYFAFSFINGGEHFLSTNFSEDIDFKKESFLQEFFLGFVILGSVLLVVIVYSLVVWKIALTKKKEITKRKLTEMQLKGIRAQMNPHFLFNALSAIQNLINKGDNEKANHYLTEFSQLMRLTLDKSEKGVVSLHEEIESIEKYLELEKLRFHFEYQIVLGEKINTNHIEIPTMLIQPFVENAIVHGLYETIGEKIIKIEFIIKDNNLQCFILDNGIGFNKAQAKNVASYKREKYGVKLAQDRINLINESYETKAKIAITDVSDIKEGQTGTQVEINLPLKY